MARLIRQTRLALLSAILILTACGGGTLRRAPDARALPDSSEDSGSDSGVLLDAGHVTDADASFELVDVAPSLAVADFDGDGDDDVVGEVSVDTRRTDAAASVNSRIVTFEGPIDMGRDLLSEHILEDMEAPWLRDGLVAMASADGDCCDLVVADADPHLGMLRFHDPLTAASASDRYASIPEELGWLYGTPPSPARDANADGVGDLLVGNSGRDPSSPMWVIDGAGWRSDSAMADVAIAQIEALGEGAFIDIGDTDGDGADEYSIGQPDDGFALLFLGPLSGSLTADGAETRVSTHPPASGYRCCTPRAGADIDGDGHSDLLLADPSLDPTNPEEYEDEALGLLAVFAGPLAAGELDLTGGATTTFQCADRLLLGEDALLADFTGDGAPDVIARTMIYGAQSAILAWSEAEPGRMDESSAHVVITPEHPDASTNFAERMAGGDVDDDGVDDLLISRGVITDDSYQMDTLVFLGPI